MFNVIFLFIFIIVLTIVIMSVVNTISMAVLERIREIGTPSGIRCQKQRDSNFILY